ncbi:HAD family hydrolase [Dactylosporangium sp. CA-092794]|uniref:HAD family hydrolase n=1 Tax=Dactylosporangium sp. CA-092794 TaxID=3239929 RepID=UPI003D9022C9
MDSQPHKPIKTLLVDIGDTLIKRSRPGPFARSLEVLTQHGVDTTDPTVRNLLTACLMTGLDRSAAAERAATTLRLAASAAAALLEALRQPEGQARMLPGAQSLLEHATQTGWRVVAVTNAALWSAELPTPIASRLTMTISSAHLGVVKQDPAFWRQVRSEYGIDPRAALVVGDNPRADGEVPTGEGYCTAVHHRDGPSLGEIAGWIAAATEAPDEVVGLVAGRCARWAGQHIMAAPHLAASVLTVTRRRVRASMHGHRPVATTLVRRRDLPPALLLPRAIDGGALVWLGAVADLRSGTMPADLRETLVQRHLSTDGLSELELRHLVSMVREARDAEVRRIRIDNVVSFLEARRPAGRNL